MTSYSEIIPDEMQAELINIRDRLTESAFKVGDITNAVLAGRKDLPKDAIYSAVAMFCGRSSRTVRYYAMVSAFYPVAVRSEYPTLSFDHFRFAMRYSDWRSVLEYAVSGETGRPETIDKLTAVLEYQEEKKDVLAVEITSQVEALRKAIYKVDIPIESMMKIKSALSIIADELNKIKTPV